MKLRGYALAVILGALIILTNCAPEKEEVKPLPPPPPPPPQAKILVEPDSTSYDGTNKDVKVSVLVEGVSNVFSVSFDLSYNPDIITYESGSVGALLGSANDILFKTSLLSDGQGTVVVGVTRRFDKSTEGVSGSGDLCILRFRTIGKGTTDLRLTNYAVLAPNGGGISVLSEDNQITVN
jgi:hypothetical protein